LLTAAGLRITGETPDGTYVEICESPTIPGSWAASSIPSSSPNRWSRIPLFKAFIGTGDVAMALRAFEEQFEALARQD
jgi:hypothetical protein